MIARISILLTSFFVVAMTSDSLVQCQEDLKVMVVIKKKWTKAKASTRKDLEVARFAGFVEGLLKTELPEEWYSVLIDCAKSQNASLDFSVYEERLRKSRRNFVKDSDERDLVMAAGISKELAKEFSDPLLHVDALQSDNFVYSYFRTAITHDGVMRCLRAGQVVWSQEVKGVSNIKSPAELTTVHYGRIYGATSLGHSQKYLYLFSWDVEGFFIAAFKKTNGTILWKIHLKIGNSSKD